MNSLASLTFFDRLQPCCWNREYLAGLVRPRFRRDSACVNQRKGNCSHGHRSHPHVPEAIRNWSLFNVSAFVEPCGAYNAIRTSCGKERRLVAVQQFLLVVHHRNYGRIRRYTTCQTWITDSCDLDRLPWTCAQWHHYRRGGKRCDAGFEGCPLNTLNRFYAENLGVIFAEGRIYLLNKFDFCLAQRETS